MIVVFVEEEVVELLSEGPSSSQDGIRSSPIGIGGNRRHIANPCGNKSRSEA